MTDSSGKKGKGKRALLQFLPTELLHPLSRIQIASVGTVVLLISAFFLPLSWLILSEFQSSLLIILAKSSSFLAIYFLAVNFVLSTRWKILERAFSGLDRMYKVHKMVGKLGLLFVFLHPVLLIVDAVPSWDTVASYLIVGIDLEVTDGILSLVALFILVYLTVRTSLPYHLWHNTHRLMVVPLVLALIHALAAGSAMAEFSLIRYSVVGICAVGIFCSAYTALLYRHIGPRYEGVVSEVKRMGDLTELWIEVGGLNFHPGQFVFVRFPDMYERKMFPFSISGYDGGIRISAKRAGDFTSEKLPTVNIGERVVVMGPYGKFEERYLAHEQDMVWIAGGIGITPFLSMAKYECEHPMDRNIHLIWSLRWPEEAHYAHELNQIEEEREEFDFTLWIPVRKAGCAAMTSPGLQEELNPWTGVSYSFVGLRP